MSEHANTGNCLSMDVLYQQCSCEHAPCKRCHEHDQPRGECSECGGCNVCEEVSRHVRKNESLHWKEVCSKVKECHGFAEQLAKRVEAIEFGGHARRQNVAMMAAYSALHACKAATYALMTFGHLAARFAQDCEEA